MKLYKYSPIQSEGELLKAIKHIHLECHKLCKQTFGKYLQNAGNVGVFCHYDDEYIQLKKIQEKIIKPSNNPNQKYFILHKPIVIKSQGDIPKTTYTHLYIRKPDPYQHHVGDIDFYLEPEKYKELKRSLQYGVKFKGARIFERPDLDMIELYDPDVDVLAYVSTKMMTEKVRVKLSEVTKL